jgi:hypothetical protein
MDSMSLENQIMQNTKDLPSESLMEVLDFIKFIREKKSREFKNNINRDLSLLNNNECEHLEEEIKDYRELYPYES